MLHTHLTWLRALLAPVLPQGSVGPGLESREEKWMQEALEKEAVLTVVLTPAPHLTFSFSWQEKDLPVGVTRSDSSFSDSELDRR